MAARRSVDELHNEATEAEAAKVAEALLNGDSLPAGFTFDPHDANHPVKRLKDADAEPSGEGA